MIAGGEDIAAARSRLHQAVDTLNSAVAYTPQQLVAYQELRDAFEGYVREQCSSSSSKCDPATVLGASTLDEMGKRAGRAPVVGEMYDRREKGAKAKAEKAFRLYQEARRILANPKSAINHLCDGMEGDNRTTCQNVARSVQTMVEEGCREDEGCQQASTSAVVYQDWTRLPQGVRRQYIGTGNNARTEEEAKAVFEANARGEMPAGPQGVTPSQGGEVRLPRHRFSIFAGYSGRQGKLGVSTDRSGVASYPGLADPTDVCNQNPDICLANGTDGMPREFNPVAERSPFNGFHVEVEYAFTLFYLDNLRRHGFNIVGGLSYEWQNNRTPVGTLTEVSGSDAHLLLFKAGAGYTGLLGNEGQYMLDLSASLVAGYRWWANEQLMPDGRSKVNLSSGAVGFLAGLAFLFRVGDNIYIGPKMDLGYLHFMNTRVPCQGEQCPPRSYYEADPGSGFVWRPGVMLTVPFGE